MSSTSEILNRVYDPASESITVGLEGDGNASFGDASTRNRPHITSDGEIFVTESERERNLMFGLSVADISAAGHRLLVDLSDTTSYPHNSTGRIDFSAIYLQVDRDSTATGRIRVGVITAINGTDATVVYFNGIAFEKSDDRHIQRDRNYAPSQLKTSVVGGVADRIAIPPIAGITAINTGVTLNDIYGNAKTPAVGDIIFTYERVAGTFNATVSGFYHSEA